MKGLRKMDVFKKEKTKHVFKMNIACAVDGGESDPSNRSQGKDTPRRKEESYESIYCSLLLWLRRGRARVSYGFVVLTLVNVTQRMFSSWGIESFSKSKEALWRQNEARQQNGSWPTYGWTLYGAVKMSSSLSQMDKSEY